MATKYKCIACRFEFETPWSTPTSACPKCSKIANKVIDVVKPTVLPVTMPVVIPNKPATADIIIAAMSSEEIIRRVMSFCDERSLGLLSIVCKRYKMFAYDVLSKIIPRMLAYGSTTHNLLTVIKGHIAADVRAQRSIRLAVDQFPSSYKFKDNLISYIIENNIAIDLVLGTADVRTIESFKKAKKQAQVFVKSGAIHKMHNKIWTIDNEGIILGSPNISYSGLEGSNYESCIYIKTPRLGHLVGQYMNLLKEPNPESHPLWKEIGNRLVSYNNEDHHVKMALSPVINIQDFIIEHIQGATKIVIRQFLISQGRRGRGRPYDIVDALCDLSWNDRVDIELYIDEGAYYSDATKHFVQPAVQRLMKNDVKVYLQKPVTVIKAHEAIQHDKLILAEFRSGKQISLIGSAGFTTAVIANENAESFIYTDVKSVYNSLMAHHKATLTPGKGTTLSWTS